MSAPRSIDCACARSHLPLFVGGDLEAPLSAAVSAHLRGCNSCRQDASAQLRAVQALGRAAERSAPTVDPAMFAVLHQQVLAAVAAEPPLAAARRGRVAGLAAAATVLFALGWWLAGGEGGLLRRSPIETRPEDLVTSPALRAGELRPLGQVSTWPEEFSACGSGSSGLQLLELRRVHTLAFTAPAGPASGIGPGGR